MVGWQSGAIRQLTATTSLKVVEMSKSGRNCVTSINGSVVIPSATNYLLDNQHQYALYHLPSSQSLYYYSSVFYHYCVTLVGVDPIKYIKSLVHKI